MKKLLTIALAIALVAVSALALAESTKLVIGASSTPHAEILEAAKPLLAEKGIDLEIVIFDDYVQPNLQLDAGDLDANYFQHIPYLENFNAENGTKLAVLGAVHYEPMGIYANPKKPVTVADVPDGASVAVPNDTTNELRALQLLVAQGLLASLPAAADGAELTLTAADLSAENNPKKLEIVEVEAAQVPRTLADTDLAVINSNYALEALKSGAVALEAAIAVEGTDISYPNVVAIREGDDRPELQTLIEVLQSENIINFITETYGTAVVPTK